MIVESAPFKSAYTYPGMQFDPATEIELMVSRLFEIKPETIKLRTRRHKVLIPRQIAIYLIRKYTALPYERIGQRFDLDHTTAIYAFQQVKNLVEVRDKEFTKAVTRIEEEIAAHPAFSGAVSSKK
jgi:chromosomal replication initiator protein